MIIYLIGLPGAGKTTFGKKIAERLHAKFIDLDHEIINIEKKEISEIFKIEGEESFRLKEAQTLKKIKDSSSKTVVSCGGGTPCFNDNMDTINDLGISIYLEVPEEILVARLKGATTSRPLLQHKLEEELLQTLRHHLETRKPHYRRATLVFSGASITTDLLLEALHAL